MKIVFVANTSWFLYNFCQTLLRTVKAEGHDVYVIAPYDQTSSKFEELGIEWFDLSMHQTSKNPLRECLTLCHLYRILHTLHPEFVLTFTIKCNLYVGLVKKVLPFEQIATLAGLGQGFTGQNIWSVLIRTLYTVALKTARKVFFQNDDDSALFLHYRLVRTEQVEHTSGLGVNLSRFVPCSIEKTDGTRVFLMFGRLLKSKGYGLFLQAARQIHKERPSQAEFWILGIPDRSREDSRNLFQTIQAFHQQQIVRYIPAVDDVRSVLHQADVVVLPSEYNEGVPACLLEAMACGKPIITTNWKGCKKTVEHGKNGFLVEKGSVEELKNAILLCLDMNSAMFIQMGTLSRQKVEREFDEQSIIAKYIREIT
ncbi:glycosyl transferase group 1 [Candidatus Moduliflexus flocculans]|uniref:Glycosyl transferase group 1 n=1 Tax=Candidatus Moduliflexus flocculans TaxID=1499966 RepID=A0A081BND9_9BACT|nr:glycosyl transferase group 1 [Candidatus Moduliflexus flocculans]